jgi:hypothetical protein
VNEAQTVIDDPGRTEEVLTEEPSRPRRWLVPALAAALVIAISLVVTFFVLWLGTADPSGEDVEKYMADQKPAVEERSTDVLKLLFTYDSTTLEQVTERMLELSTGNFAVDFEQNIIERGLGEALENAKVSSRGTILEGPDASFIGSSEAQAIFTVRQTVQNKQIPGGKSFVYVTRLTLVNVEGEGWKADRIELLSYDEV